MVRNDYSEEEYSQYLKAIIELCYRHLDVVIQERWTNSMDMMGVNGKTGIIPTNVIDVSAMLFDDTDLEPIPTFQEQTWILNKPVNRSLRKHAILLFGFSREDHSSYWPYNVIWNSLIPSIFMIITWGVLLVKHRWKESFIYTFALVKIPIICLTAPSIFFFYMLSVYLVGWASLFVGFMWMIRNRWEKKINLLIANVPYSFREVIMCG